MTLVILSSLLIGLLLGLLGGGGSILMVPMLVYWVGVEPKKAIATSLVVVGVTSLIAMLNHARHGRVCWKTGLIFGSSGMLGAYGGGRLAAFIPGGALLLLFAVIMLGTAYAMLRGRKDHQNMPTGNQPVCPADVPLLAVLFDGLLVGSLTGLVGAGGGFLVVPALNLLGGLPMHAAVGTSLFVIAMNAMSALAGYASHVSIDLPLASIVTSAAIVGSILGGMLSHRISSAALRRVFGVFVILVAGFLLYKEMTPALALEVQTLVTEHRDFLWGIATVLAILLVYWLRTWIQAHSLRHRHSRCS